MRRMLVILILGILPAACAPTGFTEGYSGFKPGELSVEEQDACSLSKPQIRVPGELYLVVEQAPYTSSRIALARGGGISELDIAQPVVEALDGEAAALADLTVAPLTDLFDVVIPVAADYQPELEQVIGRMSFEAGAFGIRQLPVLSAFDDPLALQYQFVQMTVRLRIEKNRQPLDDISASGIVFGRSGGGLEQAVRDSAGLNARALCGALRQLGVKFRRSDLFVKLGAASLVPAAAEKRGALQSHPDLSKP